MKNQGSLMKGTDEDSKDCKHLSDNGLEKHLSFVKIS